MKFEEYKEQILNLLKDPDTALTKVDDVLNNLQKDSEVFASLETANKQLEERVRTLQDTNMQLFLRASSDVKEEPEEKEKTIEDVFDELVKEEDNE